MVQYGHVVIHTGGKKPSRIEEVFGNRDRFDSAAVPRAMRVLLRGGKGEVWESANPEQEFPISI